MGSKKLSNWWNPAPWVTRCGRKTDIWAVVNFENNLFSIYLTFVNINDKKYISYQHEKELSKIALTVLLFGGVEYLLFTRILHNRIASYAHVTNSTLINLILEKMNCGFLIGNAQRGLNSYQFTFNIYIITSVS